MRGRISLPPVTPSPSRAEVPAIGAAQKHNRSAVSSIRTTAVRPAQVAINAAATAPPCSSNSVTASASHALRFDVLRSALAPVAAQIDLAFVYGSVAKGKGHREKRY
jgi:hypothetical protein